MLEECIQQSKAERFSIGVGLLKNLFVIIYQTIQRGKSNFITPDKLINLDCRIILYLQVFFKQTN